MFLPTIRAGKPGRGKELMKMQTGSESQASHDGGLQQKVVNKRRTGGNNVTIAADSPKTEVEEGRRGAKSKVNKNDQIKVDKHREPT